MNLSQVGDGFQPVANAVSGVGGLVPMKGGDQLVLKETLPTAPAAGLIEYIQNNMGGSSPYVFLTPPKAPVVTIGSSSLAAPEGTRRVSVTVGGTVYWPLVANCPPVSCTNGDPIAHALGDPATTEYENAVTEEAKRTAVLAGLSLIDPFARGFGLVPRVGGTILRTGETALVRGAARETFVASDGIVGSASTGTRLADSSSTVTSAQIDAALSRNTSAAGGTVNMAIGARVSSVGENGVNVSETVATARIRQSTMLQNNEGFNISPIAWDAYPTIGRSGTFVSDKPGVMNYFGDLAGKTETTISPVLAAQIEKDMGLVPGTLQDGFKVRQVIGVRNMQPLSPMEGNQYFQGAGKHLPGGAPEMVINSIPTVDNGVVNTILNVKVGK